MKLFSLLLFLLFGLACFAQKGLVPLKQPPITNEWHTANYNQYRTLVNCNVDTVAYIQGKTTLSKSKILYSDNTYSSQAGQFFPASGPNPITVHGFRWYGYSFDHTGGGGSPVITVDCSLYAAGSDSLPSGSPLATQSIVVDANSANSQRDVIFTTPIVMTGHYVVVVSNPNLDWLLVQSNDEDSNDGSNEGFSSSYYEPISAWRKNLDLWALGDFDFTFEPFVNYTIDAKFNVPTSGCVGIPVNFNNTSKGPFQSSVYNQDLFNGSQVSYFWDYGNGANDSYLLNGTATFSAPGSYIVSLTDTINMWTGFCTDLVTNTIDIFAIPAKPNVIPPSPVCEYTPANDLTASGSGDFTWYDNLSLTNQIGSGSPFASGILLGDTVYVTQTVNGCESTGAEVIVSFLPNALPMFTATDLGSMMIQFNGAPTAVTYTWDFGDSAGTSNVPSPTHTYTGLGPFNACLDVEYSNGCTNQYCETVTFVDIEDAVFQDLLIYPNPFNNVLVIELDTYHKTSFILLDIMGKEIMHGNLGAVTNRINLTHLDAGNYFVRLLRNDNAQTIKVIKR